MNRIPLFFAALLLLLTGQPVLAAATKYQSTNYGVESVIFGGTGTLHSSQASVPPTITSGPAASAITTTTATIGWVTDKGSNSIVYAGTSSGSYPIQAGDITDASVTNHNVALTNLTKNTLYYYKVRSVDSLGNLVDSAEKSFTTDPGDVTPPVITAGPAFARNSASSVTVTWETDEQSSSLVDFGVDAVTDNTVGRTEDLTLFHQVTVTGLQAAQTYLFRVRSRDADSNTATSATQQVVTPAAPSITEVKVSDITLNSAIIEWKTTSAASTVINYGTSSAYGADIADTSSLTATHLVRLTNLQSGTNYYFKLSGTDQSGNKLVSDEYIFRTVVLPTISGLTASETTSHSVKLSWESSSEIDELVKYEITASPHDAALVGKKGTAGNDKLVTAHSFALSELESGATYSVTVQGKDVFGNQAVSPAIRFTLQDDQEPPTLENVKTDTSVDLGSKQTVQVLVSFGLSEPGMAVIEYGQGASGAYSQKVETDTEYSRNKFMVIPGLQPGESYHFRIVPKDRAGNVNEKTPDYLVLAPSQPLSLLDLIFGQVRQNFGWLSNLSK